jgi:hypothetical protein
MSQPCRCGHSIFRHYAEEHTGCAGCPCPEYRQVETRESILLKRLEAEL